MRGHVAKVKCQSCCMAPGFRVDLLPKSKCPKWPKFEIWVQSKNKFILTEKSRVESVIQMPAILYCKTYCTENTIILSLVIGCSWFGEPILQILGMPKAGQSTMWQPCIPTFCKLYILEHVCELNKVQITEHLQTVHSNTLRKVFSRVYLGVLIWPLWSIFWICFFSTKVVASTLTSGWTCCQSFSGRMDMLHFNFVVLWPKWR